MLLDVRAQHGCDRVAVERDLSREELVEGDADRVEIGCHTGTVALNLLGREVLHGAEHDTRLGDVIVPARDAKVSQLQLPVGRHDRVVGLEVAVDDAASVDVPDRAQKLRGKVDCPGRDRWRCVAD